MSYKPPYQTLNTRRRRKGNYGVILMWALSAILVLGGLYLIIGWLSGGGLGAFSLFATDTPTPTETPTPSNTPTITPTPTITETPTLPSTPTASAPFLYTVEVGDTLSSIADKFQVQFIIIMALNGLNNDSVLLSGQQIIIPDPNMAMPEPTPLPEGLRRGTEIEYLVLPGDVLAVIANRFLSTEDAIIEANDLDNPNNIFVGQLLLVPVNLVTATPGPSPTPTGAATTAPTATP